MDKIKVMCVFGTRPEGIKMSPVVLELFSSPQMQPQVVLTGQHREMLDQVMGFFDIKPLVDLNIMQQKQTLTGITVRALTGLEDVIRDLNPHILLVQGDTTTAFVAALAAFYNKTPVGHIEAGLRTDNKYNPFPEEMNRRLITSIADLHFAPTRESFQNLLRCGVAQESVFLTGNTVVDALNLILNKENIELPQKVRDFHDPKNRILFVETHRRENLGRPMTDVCTALKELINHYEDIEIIFSVHKNPLVREVVYEHLGNVPRVLLMEPVDYPVMLRLMKESYFVLTDSGGLQEEAPSLGSPVLVLRENTERPEGVRAGNAKLVGTSIDKILSEASKLLEDKEAFLKMSKAMNPYGDGLASKRITDAILYFFGKAACAPKPFEG